ncbi:thioredoxin domain-containing protein [Sansalvadorimonas sp. 2012CJ34-2]|uniref:Thiol:disulfide interchange protein n=1 Tax=Parendozoicomonas callyspongiae TaxID=2942213 RepID=A0ABT0PC69_9GAMM|nr:thioredoxin domain-containing protein [Sansalvadorimonas sp. 2012CJ34-2]MCL6268816.1 thioredoxin domain-containing protein [Sansalvadorimonas sp. 2012CJ34-2]
MMRKLAAAFLLLTLPFAAFGYNFSEGQNYVQLPQNFRKTAQPTLTEVYSIYCGHCYKWEKNLVQTVKQDMARKKVVFNQAHIAYVAEYGDKVSKALLVAEKQGKLKAVKNALFSSVHDEMAGDWTSDRQFFATLAKAGLSQKEFEKNVSNPELKNTFKLWEGYEQNVPSTPSFIVNGRYLIKMDSLESFDQFYALIDYLLAQS